ncbi:MAG: cellobiohydrolase, partial [Moraxellaceae bacterium]
MGSLAALAIAAQTQAATCTYKIDNQWNTGYTGTITIANNGSSAITGWTVGWSYSKNRITSSWSATVSGSNPYSATALDWNKTIQPGQSVSFGFQGDTNGVLAEVPTVTGAVCGNSTSSTTTSSSSSIKTSSSVATSSSSSSVKTSSSTTTSASSSVKTSTSSSRPSSSSSTPKSSSSSSSIVNQFHMQNPFDGAKWYVNQDWATQAIAYGGAAGAKIAKYSTAVWMDRIGAIDPADPTVMGLRDHLDAALDQGANVFQVVVYDLPNRDCFALASNGELKIKENGFNRYKNEYVNPLAAILADSKYRGIRIIAIIEPDSLPNLVTNLSDPDCQEAAGAGGYVEATQYTLNKLSPITNVYSYIDIGHSGWLGWDTNFSAATTFIANAIKGTTKGVNSIDGFISNTANATPLKEPYLDAYANAAMPGSNGGVQVRQAKFYEWNPNFSELAYVKAWRTKMISLGFPEGIGMLIDTSRNGWGGTARPIKLSTATDVDLFVNQSRIDRRVHRGMWCNQPSGIGERPTIAPE